MYKSLTKANQSMVAEFRSMAAQVGRWETPTRVRENSWLMEMFIVLSVAIISWCTHFQNIKWERFSKGYLLCVSQYSDRNAKTTNKNNNKTENKQGTKRTLNCVSNYLNSRVKNLSKGEGTQSGSFSGEHDWKRLWDPLQPCVLCLVIAVVINGKVDGMLQSLC